MCLTSLNEVISIIYIIIIVVIIIIIIIIISMNHKLFYYHVWLQSVAKRLEAPTHLFSQNCLSDIV